MKYKTPFLIILLWTSFVLAYCSNLRQSFDLEAIKGNWCLNKKQLNYPKLRFDDKSTLTLSSIGDTIYRYNYLIQGAFLSIQKDGKTIKNKILKLNRDSLILEGLLEHTTIQKYSRCK